MRPKPAFVAVQGASKRFSLLDSASSEAYTPAYIPLLEERIT